MCIFTYVCFHNLFEDGRRKKRRIKTANTTINGGGDIHLESEYTANSKREEANTEIECKIHIEPEEQFSEPIQSPPGES